MNRIILTILSSLILIINIACQDNESTEGDVLAEYASAANSFFLEIKLKINPIIIDIGV